MSNNTGLEIAIIGMDGRFPEAKNVEEYWNNLISGIESVSFYTDEELLQSGVKENELQNPSYIKANCILRDKEFFDSDFFNYRPDEAKIMDPQMRIFHECVWSAIEDAGINLKKNNNIGLFASASSNLNWEVYSKIINSNGQVDSFTSNILDNARFLSSRISYLLNFTGPSVFLDTACSSALVCIHSACRSLLLSDCYIAIAGGIKVTNISKKGYLYQEGMINSKNGHCCPFDEKASGSIGGEGTGVVVLKKLNDAIKDGDHIYAIIKGSGINNDGNNKIGYAAPSINGQVEVILKALKWAKVEPESIGYLETHGTGTLLGDPIEFEALNKVFGKSETPYCALGSVKANIGHLDVAAGVAGLIKIVLVLKHKQIPPSINFANPNPKINFNKSAFYVNTKLRDWQKNDNNPFRAAVSSFGIGGTNVHVVLEEAPKPEPTSESREYQLLIFSSKTVTALERNVENFINYLKENNSEKLSDIAYTLQIGRNHFPYRKLIVCKDRTDAINLLSSVNQQKKISPLKNLAKQTIVFMFPGQGSQYIKMCYDLYNKEEYFRKEADRCFEIANRLSGRDFKSIIFGTASCEFTELDEIKNSHPALFIVEYALAQLLIQWGITPDVLIGYSLGEYVAACISGVFSLENALFLVLKRAELMGKVRDGKMLGISISEERLKPILVKQKDISLATVNSSELCTVAGKDESILNFQAIVKKKGYTCKIIPNSHPHHSSMMDGILEDYEREVSKVKISKQQIPFISNLTGKQAIDSEISNHQYWVRHLRQTVRFSDGISTLFKNKEVVFIEMGPGVELSIFVRSNKLREKGHKVVSLVRHQNTEGDDLSHLLVGLGKIWVHGIEPNWSSFYENESRRKVSLPSYSFDKIKYPAIVNAFNMITEKRFANIEHTRKNISDWYYIPTWKLSRKRKNSNITKVGHSYLIFEDAIGISMSLIDMLNKNKANVIRVSLGEKFIKLTSHHYIINPEVESNYIELFSNLNSSGNLPDHIIHGFGITGNLPEYLTKKEFRYFSNIFFHSVVQIIKATQKYGGLSGKQFHVLTSELHHIYQPSQCVAVKSLVIGLLKVIPQEYPSTNCKHIDISLEEKNSPGFVENIFQEIVCNTGDKTVSLRQSKRWLQTFEKITISNKEESCFKQKGVYLVTGGLGLIGYAISYYLVKTYHAKIILIGRTKLPDQNTWETYLVQENTDRSIVEKIQKIQKLQAERTEVLYLSCDLSSHTVFSEIIKKSEDIIGKINGVIHTAGVLKGKSINPLSQLAYSDYLEQFNAKIMGLEILIDYFKHRDLDFCLIYSSLSAILGGLNFGAYSSANVYMDYRINSLRGNGLLNNWLTIDFEKDRSMTEKELMEVVNHCLHLKDYSQIIVSTTDLEKRLVEWVLNRGEIENDSSPEIEKGEEESSTDLNKILEKGLSKNEESLIILWQKFFNISGLSVLDDFFEIGGNSLQALTLIGRIYKELGVRLSMTEFFKNTSIKSLSALIDEFAKTEYVKILKAPKKEYYKLSSAQKRLLFLCEFYKKSLSYNVPQVVKLEGNIDKVNLSNTFNKLIARHESLRTSFEVINDEAVQKIFGRVNFEIEYFQSGEDQIQQIIKDFIRPFDLNQAPLMRAGLIEISTTEYILMVDMPHIITDGVSHKVLIKDFMILYNNEELPELKLQYKDYAEWQQSEKQQEKIAQQKAFWLNEYAEEIVSLDLPTDKRRPLVKNNKGNSVEFSISIEETSKLISIAESEKATLFMVLLSMFNILLSKLSNHEDIIVGTPVAGRGHPDLERIIGMFVNTLPLRNYPKGELSFREFLSEVKNKTLACFDNQAYQYEELIDELKILRDTSRNPLFDEVFVFEKLEEERLKIPGLTLIPQRSEHTTSKFDLLLNALQADGQIHFKFEYSTQLFKKKTIEKYIEYFKNIITLILNDNNKTISDISILSEKDKDQILNKIKGTVLEVEFDF
jgi:iturin family lipopeptide synthetase A